MSFARKIFFLSTTLGVWFFSCEEKRISSLPILKMETKKQEKKRQTGAVRLILVRML